MTVILVVDDDAPQRDILKIILSDEGYQTHVASSGEEALRVAETVEPDVVLTDLRMGHMDGLELMKELRRRKNAPEVIVMSAWGTMVAEEEIIKKGAFRYMAKPLEKYRLLLNIKQALTKAALSENEDCQTLFNGNRGCRRGLHTTVEDIP